MSGWDLVVVGGGAAGLAAARAGVAADARTMLVSAGPLGGDCTHTGCVPSKALIGAARRGEDHAAARVRIRESIARIAATEDEATLGREGIEVRRAHARLEGRGTVDVGGTPVDARRIVIATGSRPEMPPIPGLTAVPVLTNENVFGLERLPASLAVIGGGPIGCELAQAFARFGTSVTVIEALDRLLIREEPAASRVIAAALAADGVTIMLDAMVTSVDAVDGGATLHLGDGERLTVERILVAAGRRPTTDDLGLGRAGVGLTERGHIRVDDRLRTTAAGIYAAGDVTGVLAFTHAADEMGRIAARNALSRRPRKRFPTAAVPWVTFTDPEVARVGLSEAEAVDRGGARVAHLPMAEVDRAIIEGRTEGFVTLIAGRRRLVGDLGGGRLLGATIVAPHAGEMIHEATLAVRTGMFAGRIAQTVHAYPTWSVAMRLAAAQLVMEVGGRRARPAGAGEPAA